MTVFRRNPGAAPAAVRGAGLLVAVQGTAALVTAVALVVRFAVGGDQRVVHGAPASGWYSQATAVFFVLVGAVVLAAGRALILGKRWGRGLAVITQLLLLPVAWYLTVGSHRPGFGVPAGIAAVAVLGMLFSPAGLRWAGGGDQRDSASSANRGPDSR
ncbi:hypothetical protein [Mycobacterium sp. E1747]|uniref:hypothetical protein n=1 Tax=Mycobacterium sp. E1747 TaxID=1834128 RepID=UPI0008017550|nr:hypothetical protein [Mycobacterium sp. E1747]OBH03913.1 hypothetical protein A5695_09725 [Mycobacterium sp. E1747]